MTTALTAQQLEQHLLDVLKPQSLQVIDESSQHHGHAGANGSGYGTHFRVRISSHLFTGLCMMRCKISWTKVCTRWPLKPRCQLPLRTSQIPKLFIFLNHRKFA